MNRTLTGKLAAVSGGARGIGRAIVEALAARGATVAYSARTQESIDAAQRELSGHGNVAGTAADVSDPLAVDRWFTSIEERFGGLDILVNNAGIGIFRPVHELSVEDWTRTIAVNLNGPFFCTRAALPLFARRGGGYVFNIGSLAGKNPFAAGAAYNASKFGLNGFSEALMLDERQQDVRVTQIMPGSVDTDFSPRGGRAEWKIAPEDIAQVIVDLLAMPSRTLVSRVEMRPAKPPAKG